MSNRIRRLLARMRPLHSRCEELAQQDDARLLAITPASGWSIGHHLHHLGQANGSVCGALRQLVTEPAQLEPGRWQESGRPRIAGRIVLLTGYIPRGVKAPDFVVPPPAPTREDIHARLADAGDRLAQLEPLIAELAAHKRRRVLHPIIGWLNPPQWLRFIAIHTRHHLKVIREIEAALPAQQT